MIKTTHADDGGEGVWRRHRYDDGHDHDHLQLQVPFLSAVGVVGVGVVQGGVVLVHIDPAEGADVAGLPLLVEAALLVSELFFWGGKWKQEECDALIKLSISITQFS